MNEVTNPRRGRWIAVVVAVLALAVVACVCGGGGTDTPTLVPSDTTTGGTTTGGTTDTAGGTTTGGTTTGDATTTTGGTTDGGTTDGSTTDSNLEILNETADSICYVYIAPYDDLTSWGNEVLGESTVIGAGASDVVSGPPGIYDIILEDCSHNVIAWLDDVDLTTDQVVTVSGTTDVLVVENTSTFQICGIYISAPDSQSWGHSLLNPDHPIEPNSTRRFAVTAGTWDLKAVSCDGQELERLGSELSGEMIWTLTTE